MPTPEEAAGAAEGGPGATREDHIDAETTAVAAGRTLVALRRELADAPADQRRRAGDLRANRELLEHLTARHPDDAVLSEEVVDDQARLEARRVWIVDPLDGTREFGEPSRSDWAVHVALAVDGRAVAGAVALPAQGLVRSTAHPAPSHPAWSDRRRIAVSRTRPPTVARDLARVMGAELVAMGSAGAKCLEVVDGRADAYVHAGGMYEWDAAAPVAVALAHGLVACGLDGAPPRFNQPNPYLDGLVVCRPGLAGELLTALSDLHDRGGHG